MSLGMNGATACGRQAADGAREAGSAVSDEALVLRTAAEGYGIGRRVPMMPLLADMADDSSAPGTGPAPQVVKIRRGTGAAAWRSFMAGQTVSPRKRGRLSWGWRSLFVLTAVAWALVWTKGSAAFARLLW